MIKKILYAWGRSIACIFNVSLNLFLLFHTDFFFTHSLSSLWIHIVVYVPFSVILSLQERVKYAILLFTAFWIIICWSLIIFIYWWWKKKMNGKKEYTNWTERYIYSYWWYVKKIKIGWKKLNKKIERKNWREQMNGKNERKKWVNKSQTNLSVAF